MRTIFPSRTVTTRHARPSGSPHCSSRGPVTSTKTRVDGDDGVEAGDDALALTLKQRGQHLPAVVAVPVARLVPQPLHAGVHDLAERVPVTAPERVEARPHQLGVAGRHQRSIAPGRRPVEPASWPARGSPVPAGRASPALSDARGAAAWGTCRGCGRRPLRDAELPCSTPMRSHPGRRSPAPTPRGRRGGRPRPPPPPPP